MHYPSPKAGARKVARAPVRHRCTEGHCGKTYGRKGDLERHRRERHGGNEYRCPVARCPHHAKGNGLPRLYRLVSHLWKPSTDRYTRTPHPRLRRRKDAEFIANDYNNCIMANDQLMLDDGNPTSSARGSQIGQFHSAQVEDLGDMLKYYAETIVTGACPKQRCGKRFAFGHHDFSWGRYHSSGSLRRHLCDDHNMGWEAASEMARKWHIMMKQELDTKREAAEVK
jgi:hypothetical protein